MWSIERAQTHTEPSLLIRQISLENHNSEFLHPSAAWECLSRPSSVPDGRRSIDVPVSVTHTDSTCSNRRSCSPSSCSKTHKTEISHNEIDRFNSLFQLFDGVTMILSFSPNFLLFEAICDRRQEDESSVILPGWQLLSVQESALL